MTEPDPIDPAAIVAEIEAEVRRRRAAGGYPEALLARLRTEFRPDESLEPPEILASLEPSRPLRSDRPGIGRGIVFGKRVIRRLISWYVAPIAQDQTRFNVAIVRELRALERRIARLQTAWSEPEILRQPHADIAPSAAALTDARVSAAVSAIGGASLGTVLVVGADSSYVSEISARWPHVDVVEGDALDWLRAAPAASVSAVVLTCLLPRLSPRELIDIVPLGARALRDGGVLICDGPDPSHPDTPSSAADVDPTLRQHIGFQTFDLLARAAGLENVRHEPLAGGRWYLAFATRAGPR